MSPHDDQSSEAIADKVKVIPASESDKGKGDQGQFGTGGIYVDLVA